MTASPLPAVGGPWWETGVALSADLLVTVVLGCEDLERWLDDSSTETVRVGGKSKYRQCWVIGWWLDIAEGGAGGLYIQTFAACRWSRRLCAT